MATTAASSRASLAASLIPGLSLLALAALFASWACFQQFGGYDLSPLIDAFWRIRIGQVPGVDFINTFPPLIYLSAKLAALVDLGWYELTATAILHTSAAFVMVMGMTPPAQRTPQRSITVAAVLSLPLLYTNHLWHSSSSQLIGAIFVYALHRSVVAARTTTGDLVWIAGGSALLVLAKQNVALPLLALGVVAVLFTGDGRRWPSLGAMIAGTIVGLVAGLSLVGMSLAGFAATYTAVVGRGMPNASIWHGTAQIGSSLLVIGAIAGALAFMGSRLLQRHTVRERGTQLLILLLPAVLYPLATDWDAKMNDAVLPMFLVCCWAWSDAQERAAKAEAADLNPLILIIGFLLLTAMAMGFTRERMYHVGPGTFWEANADHRIAAGYLAGMHSGPRLDRVLQEEHQLRRAHPASSLFFGPRLEFSYRELHAPPPRDLPLWWHPGSSYAVGDESRIIHAFAAQHIDYLVFLGDDRTRMPLRLLRYIDKGYRQLPGRGELQVFKRLH